MKKLYHRFRMIMIFKVVAYLLLARKKLYSLLCRRFEREKVMVNVGGGMFIRPHWKVLDHPSSWYSYYPAFIDIDLDLSSESRFPFDDDSVTFFYCCHTLEHIPGQTCPHILREMHRCLKPGGAARLTVPDYDLAREAYENKDREFFKTYPPRGLCLDEVLVWWFAALVVGRVDPEEIRENYERMEPAEFADHYTSLVSREEQSEKTGNHINWFDHAKLSGMLREAGFKTVYRSRHQGSRL